MKTMLAIGTLVVLVAGGAIAQAPPTTAPAAPPPAPPSGQKTLAATLNVYVFPTVGQDAAKQSTDEATCYNWAVQNTGSDPFSLQKQAQQQATPVGAGSGAKGAVAGAAAGMIAGRRRGQAAQAQATQQVTQQGQQAQQATAEQIENFKKAFSVCLEAQKYMVKY